MTLFTDRVEFDLEKRPRRNRKSPAIRAMITETRLHPSMLVAPLFVVDGSNQKQPITSMPHIFRFSIDLLVKEVRELQRLGICSVNLFCVVDSSKKDAVGSEATRPGNLLQKAVSAIKNEIPEICVMADIALDPFTDHGHDGLVDANGYVVNDASLEVLGQMCLRAAEAGADVVSPSDMMDGRVKYIRKLLDKNGFENVSILSYAAKYASAFYGPFRSVLDSVPKFGDKKGYQLEPANARQALLELKLDEEEGADLLLIKPAIAYLDIIAKAKQITNLPLGAFHVSGEYAMVMAAAQNGWIDADRALEECLVSIKRAGADFILTYAARRMAELLI